MIRSTMQNSEGCFHDISLSSSLPICRICHACGSDEEDLIQPCRCSGSVGYVHESCLRKWIIGSTNLSCELCNHTFKTETKLVLNIRKLQFPRPSLKGCFHMMLFLAFFSIMLTSLTWIMWSQFSSSQAAQSERESKEITYVYAVNGGFIIMALIGLYLDSFGQCRIYYRRWSLLNKELRIFSYDVNEDAAYCNKAAGLLSSPHGNTAEKSPEFHVTVGEALVASTPNTSANESDHAAPRDGTSSFSYQNEGFAREIEILENPFDLRFVNTTSSNSSASETTSQRHQWLVKASSYVVPSRSMTEQPTLHQSMSAPADLQNILVLKETYV